MSHHGLLGIAHDATVVEVKRAYAKALKLTRPDGDPLAFQALQEAYTHCLEHAKYREVNGEDPEEIEDEMAFDFSEVTRDTSTGSLEDIELSFQQEESDETFIEQFTERFVSDEPTEMARWLNAHPAMVSIIRKDAMRWDVLDAMDGVFPAVSEKMMEVVKQFFGLDQLDFRAPWLIDRLTTIEGEFDSAREFKQLKEHYSDPRTKYFDRLIYRELTAPFNWARRLFCMLMFGIPSRIGELWMKLETIDPTAARATVRSESALFWFDANLDNTITWQRLSVVVTRILFWVPLASMSGIKDKDAKSIAWLILGNIVVWTLAWMLQAAIRMGIYHAKRYKHRND